MRHVQCFFAACMPTGILHALPRLPLAPHTAPCTPCHCTPCPRRKPTNSSSKVHLQLVQHCGLAGVVKAHHEQRHLLLPKQPAGREACSGMWGQQGGERGGGARATGQGQQSGVVCLLIPVKARHAKLCPWALPVVQEQLPPSCSPAEELGEGQAHGGCLGAGRTRGVVARQQQADGRGGAPCLLRKTLVVPQRCALSCW